MAMGRPTRPYRASWPGPDGRPEEFPGLYKCPDGRWRIVATGTKFTEADERRAVAKFRAWQRDNAPAGVSIIAPFVGDLKPIAPEATANGVALPMAIVESLRGDRTVEQNAGQEVNLSSGYTIPEAVLWPWLRELFVARPEYVAGKIGIPELARLADLPQRSAPHKLAALVKLYEEHGTAKPQARRATVVAFKRLTDHAGASTLADLTTDKLLAFRSSVEADPALKSSGSRRQVYQRVRGLIRFALKVGISDPSQVRSAVDRCAVLWTAEPLPQVDPRPISRDDFQKLLAAAGNGPWRAWLLLGLNLCLHISEVCRLRWDDFDLDAGTFSKVREKTERRKIPRAATLWPETIAVLKALPRRAKSPWVFTSSHGKDFNKTTRGNDFKDFREKAGLSEVRFDDLRDGAYTAASRGAKDNEARSLAGHKAPGLQSSYVLINPDYTRPACEAVYKAYGPFPL